MVYAIILIYLGMTQAEQTVIIEAACNAPAPVVEHSYSDNESITDLFADGSTLTVTNYSTVARSADGLELYYID